MARYQIIACHVLWRELCYYASLSRNVFDFRFLKQGLHNSPEVLRRELQRAIDETDGDFAAILIGYGLCSNGIEGIVARQQRLVVMRGHDCITPLLGSKERFRKYFDAHPGTYWYTPGWIDTDGQPSKKRYDRVYQTYVEKYGEDNAEYLMEMEQGWFKAYNNAAYVDLGFGENAHYKEYTQECARWLKWGYDELPGDPRLVQRFVAGDWNSEDFLVVEPGQTIVASHDERVIKGNFRVKVDSPNDARV
jgi:hypothetical protein